MHRVKTFLGAAMALGFLSASAQAQSNPYLKGAFTDVPASAQPPEYRSLVDGGPLHIISGITGVEFHVPGKISSEPGGLSPIPIPILREDNGTKYWFISGEISSYATDELGQRLVLGPIDPQGVNHRNEEYCTPCEGECVEDPSTGAFDPALCCAPGEPVPHPRAGLPGVFFGLRIPVNNFNGDLIQTQPAADGGTTFPAAPLLWSPVDTGTLLARGYAVFSYGTGGTVRQKVQEEGPPIVDTNPYSGSGIFFEEIWNTGEEWAGLKPNYRVALADRTTGVETILDNGYNFPLEVGGDVFSVGFGCNAFFYGSLQKWNPEGMSDSVILAKNIIKKVMNKAVSWAAFVGWSGSGAPAIQIASSTRCGAFQVPFGTGSEVGGGNYNTWGQPKSGLRFNAFLSYAGVDDCQDYIDIPGTQADVSRDFPISAPFVWFVPEYDHTLPQSAAYHYANEVWQTLADLGKGAKINDYLRIYSLPKATHLGRGQLFAGFDSKVRRNGLWYEYKDILPNADAFNTLGRGFRMSDNYVQYYQANPYVDGWDYFPQGLAKLPRDTPLWLQTLDNLKAYAKFGIPLPVSRVDAGLFSNPGAITTDTARPNYTTQPFFDGSFEEFLAYADEQSHLIQEDTGFPAFPDSRPPYSPSFNFTDDEVATLKSFGLENPLKRSVKPLLLPDVAAPTGGPGFYDGDLIIQRFLTKSEFKALYGSHAGYVAAFTVATLQRILEHLWDPKLAAQQIAEAIAHPVPLAAPGKSSLSSVSAKALSLKLDSSDLAKPHSEPIGDDAGCGNSWRCR